ncbi:MAG: MFS transporter [Chloroflexia bacterium]|nr:MFS transporter [Chloroflexia bacterium]
MQMLLSNRAFARFWSAGLFFLLAWWALHAVMLIYVFQLTGSPFATGLIPVFSSLPGIVLGPIAGVLVDRWDRKRVMSGSALILVGLMVVTLPFAGDVDVSVLYAIIFVQSMVMTFFSPAENALLPTLVPIEDLTTANSLNALNDSLGRIVGPAAGAWTLVQFGFAATLVVSALLYLAGWALLIGIRHEQQHVPGPSEADIRSLVRSVLASFLEGLRFVRERPALFLVVAVFALFMVADVPLSAVLPAFMIESVDVSPEVFGSLMSVRGLTGLLGGLLVVILSRRVHETWLLAGGLLLHGLSFLTFGLANNLVGTVLVLIPIGPAAAAIQTGLFTMLQKSSPDAMRGRVFALTGTINGLIVLVVSVTAGGLGEAFGTRVIVIASGCLHVLPLLLVVAFLWRKHAGPRV